MRSMLMVFILTFLYRDETDIYTISFQNINGINTEMISLSEKRILVMTVDAVNPDLSQIRLTDSVAHTDTIATKLIVVPALDLAQDTQQFSIDTLYARFAGMTESGIIISVPSMVKKSAAGNQHPLLKWLTNVSENGHFDNDVVKDCQLFMINEQGVPYGVHTGKLNAYAIRNAILQTVTE